MMNASEARKRATSISNATNASLLAEIEHKIEQAVEAGNTSVSIAYLSNPNVRKALQDNGYKVTNNDDPRERECWTTISW
jgi:predicted kinase